MHDWTQEQEKNDASFPNFISRTTLRKENIRQVLKTLSKFHSFREIIFWGMTALRNMSLKICGKYLHTIATWKKHYNGTESLHSNPKNAVNFQFHMTNSTCKIYVATKILWKSFYSCMIKKLYSQVYNITCSYYEL